MLISKNESAKYSLKCQMVQISGHFVELKMKYCQNIVVYSIFHQYRKLQLKLMFSCVYQDAKMAICKLIFIFHRYLICCYFLRNSRSGILCLVVAWMCAGITWDWLVILNPTIKIIKQAPLQSWCLWSRPPFSQHWKYHHHHMRHTITYYNITYNHDITIRYTFRK